MTIFMDMCSSDSSNDDSDSDGTNGAVLVDFDQAAACLLNAALCDLRAGGAWAAESGIMCCDGVLEMLRGGRDPRKQGKAHYRKGLALQMLGD